MKKEIENEKEKEYRETVEKIAGNIANLSRAVASLVAGPLKRRALVVLLASSSGMSQDAVTRVLKALEELEGDWLNKK